MTNKKKKKKKNLLSNEQDKCTSKLNVNNVLHNYPNALNSVSGNNRVRRMLHYNIQVCNNPTSSSMKSAMHA